MKATLRNVAFVRGMQRFGFGELAFERLGIAPIVD